MAAPSYGAVHQPAPSVERFIPPLEQNAWVAKVFGIYGLQTLFVSGLCMYCMLDEGTRDSIQAYDRSSTWVPIGLLMVITFVALYLLSDRSPANIAAQFVYLLVWGTALACVTAGHYPGYGVLLTPGVLIVGSGVLILAAWAKMTKSPFDFTRAYLVLVVLSSVVFQYVCWSHEDQFSGFDYPVWLAFTFCNLYMALVEAYLVWKTGQQQEESKCGDVWAVTATLLQESFGMPLLMPLPVVAKLVRITWRCWQRSKEKEEPQADPEAYVAPYAASYTWRQLANPGAEGQSWTDWLYGREPEKTPGELRDERYVGYVMCMDMVLRQWERREIDNEDALQRLDHYRDKIIHVDEVDSERARVMLEKEGLTDNLRRRMLTEYQSLRRIGGYEVPPNDLGGISNKSSQTQFAAGLESIFRAT